MPTDETSRVGVLLPAVADAARRAGADAVGLVDLGAPGGIALRLDRVGVGYGDGRQLGDPAAPEQVSVVLVGPRPVPSRALPPVVSRETVAPCAIDALPAALARVPEGALPVVTTTWTLSGLSVEDRLRFLRLLGPAAGDRPVAWVSVEGVGVAPSVPTMGDRPASGHSIAGVALVGHTTLHVEAVARCWSRGTRLAWLVDG